MFRFLSSLFLYHLLQLYIAWVKQMTISVQQYRFSQKMAHAGLFIKTLYLLNMRNFGKPKKSKLFQKLHIKDDMFNEKHL